MEVHGVKLAVFYLHGSSVPVPEDGSVYLLGLQLSFLSSHSFLIRSSLFQWLLFNFPTPSLLHPVSTDVSHIFKSGAHG